MTIFLDTASLDDVRKYMGWGIIRGITTNQKIFSKEGNIDYTTRIRNLLSYRVPTSLELTKTEGSDEELVDEALAYSAMSTDASGVHGTCNVVIKVPMWKSGRGLRIARKLLDENVKVNVTCMMTLCQGILAAELGATYASLFYNRMKDASLQADIVVADLRHFIDIQGYDTKIIAGSIRKPEDVDECFIAGAHIVTVPPKILEQMPYHPKTEETIAEFDEAWKQFRKLK